MSDTTIANVALGKRAIQSSLSEWSVPNEAGHAVNGQKTGLYAFHTAFEQQPWWQVDLGAVHRLSRIVVYNRTDAHAERAATLAINIARSEHGPWLEVYSGFNIIGGVADDAPLEIWLDGIEQGRFVRLSLAEPNYLHLDEVEVFGTPVAGDARLQEGRVEEGGPDGVWQYRDPLDLPKIEMDAVGRTIATGVWLLPPGTPREYIREPPEFHDDPDEAGVFVGFVRAPGDCAPVFTVSAAAARLIGNRTLLTPEGWFVCDESFVQEKERVLYLQAIGDVGSWRNERTGLRRLRRGEDFGLDLGGREERHLAGATWVLGSAEPDNYGSWLFRVLPKLLAHSETRAGASMREARVLVPVNSRTYWDYLVLAGLDPALIVPHDPSVVYRLDQAIMPADRNPAGFLDGETVALFAAMRDRVEPGPARRRIYVTRARLPPDGRSGRIMVNERELEPALAAAGFDIVAPERLTAAEQVRTFAEAALVVGPSGSGMFNVVFCRPGTKVIDIESEPHWIHAHTCLFASLGLRYGIFEARAADRNRRVHHKPFTVNIGKLVERIELFAAAG